MLPFFRSRRNRQFSVHDRLPFIEAPAAESPVCLTSLDIRVAVTGLYAETTQTMHFYNGNARDLEGTLGFPVPDGAAVCGYALDVEGVMVDGVVVPREEARQILEAEQRKGVDPGLVEQVQGNLYRTRIYPIPARGSRTIRVTYVSDLTVDGNDAAYHLPLSHASQLDEVSLRVEVLRAPVEPELLGGFGNLSLDRWQNRWVAEATLARGAAVEDLQVRLPALPDSFTTVERNENGVFFCTSCRMKQAEERPSWKPERLGLAWDASGSRSNIALDLDLLRLLLEAWQEVIVDVLVFRNVASDGLESFAITGGRGEQMLSWLAELPYDGATDLRKVDLGSQPGIDTWLFFSDGMGTVGAGLPSPGDSRVITISSQAACNSDLLQHLAARTGGKAINLLRTPPAQACDEILSANEGVAVEGVEGCDSLHLKEGFGRLAIIGKLMHERARLELAGIGAPEAVVVTSSEAEESGLIARAWAAREAGELALTEGPDAPNLLDMARRYSLVTPGTSLLVLESLEQYLDYDIEPPGSLPEMVEAYHSRRRAMREQDKEIKKQHIGVVLEWWQDRITWWQTDFSAVKRWRAEEPAIGLQAPSPAAPPSMEDGLEYEMAREGSACAPSDAVLDDTVDASPEPSAQASIQIKAWSPDTPYLEAMRAVSPDEAYRVYLEQRPGYRTSPAFFLDCGDHLLCNDQPELGLRVLSNILELGLDDPALKRIFAWRLQQANELELAIEVLEQVHRMRGDEPQSYRDLALALIDRWQVTPEEAFAERAIDLLYHVISHPWENFPEIEIVALMELNRLLYLCGKAGVPVPDTIDPRLIQNLDLDLRISMSWDADLTDVDLHVFEPTGEHAYYGHNRTTIGGLVSRDFTRGYGPEEYILRVAEPGTYTIKTHYYGSSQQSLVGPCTVTATVFTNWGRPEESRQTLTLRLDQPSDQVVVGEVTIEGSGGSGPPGAAEDWQKTFRQLHVGMTMDEISQALGQPAEVRGDDEIVLVYRPGPSIEVHLRLAPRLVSVQQVMEGATLDLLA